MISIIGLGAGGHAKVVIETLMLAERYRFVGLLDPDSRLWQQKVLGIPVLGDDSLMPELLSQGVRHAFMGLGSTGSAQKRIDLFNLAKAAGFTMVNAVHPRAIISPSAKLGEGLAVMAAAVINADARVGNNVIINTAAVIEHDCVIEDHVHVASGAKLASTVNVGEGAHIGLGASVLQCLTIGYGAIIGAGAVVVDNIGNNETVVGVPARVR